MFGSGIEPRPPFPETVWFLSGGQGLALDFEALTDGRAVSGSAKDEDAEGDEMQLAKVTGQRS